MDRYLLQIFFSFLLLALQYSAFKSTFRTHSDDFHIKDLPWNIKKLAADGVSTEFMELALLAR